MEVISQKIDFDVLLIGAGINAYYMARNFHEEYGIISNVITKVAMNFTSYSTICNVEIEANLYDENVFKQRLADFGVDRGKKIILVGTEEVYIRLIVDNAEFLSEWYLFNYVDKLMLDDLFLKEKFYKNYMNYNINIPQTYFYKCGTENLDLNEIRKLGFPLIVKPSNSIKWDNYGYFDKIQDYKSENLEELQNIVDTVENLGYDDTLIIQEYIAGDDYHLFDSAFYCSSDGKPLLQSFAQIGLKNYLLESMRECSVVVNGYNQFNNTDDIKDELKKFLAYINYRGIAEFHLKYDIDRKKFYVLEINPYQARSSYYLTSCGYSIAKYLVDDLIYNKKSDFKFIDDEIVFSFVPINVVKRMIDNKEYVNKILTLFEEGKFIKILNYSGDKCLKRKLWLLVRKFSYTSKNIKL